jgi:ligand-binding SRPBCC domain-containing protein
VFSFFSRPENLELLTPRSLHFQMLTPSPIPMKEGMLVDYVIRLLGASFRWTTCITEFNPPHAFVDVQLRGPYSFWHHTHTFQAAGNGTLMTDEVRYAMPFGLLGRAVHRIFVHRQLEKIFSYRERRMQTIFDEYADPSPGKSIRVTAGKTP